MAWEWSHTPEAYTNAYEQTKRLPRATLLTILREWSYDDRDKANRLPKRAISEKTGRARGFRRPAGLWRLDRDTLADLVWQRAEEQRRCTNGGWEAYLCPEGCHRVPFDPPADMKEDS